MKTDAEQPLVLHTQLYLWPDGRCELCRYRLNLLSRAHATALLMTSCLNCGAGALNLPLFDGICRYFEQRVH